MIRATVLNTKTKECKELTFQSYSAAEKIITALNKNMPEIGFLMLMDWEQA